MCFVKFIILIIFILFLAHFFNKKIRYKVLIMKMSQNLIVKYFRLFNILNGLNPFVTLKALKNLLRTVELEHQSLKVIKKLCILRKK